MHVETTSTLTLIYGISLLHDLSAAYYTYDARYRSEQRAFQSMPDELKRAKRASEKSRAEQHSAEEKARQEEDKAVPTQKSARTSSTAPTSQYSDSRFTRRLLWLATTLVVD